MGEEDDAGRQQIITIPVKFYRCIKAVANFLELHPDTVRKLILQAKIPAERDETGRLVLVNVEYYQSLQG